MPYLEILSALNRDVSTLAIQNQLERAGFICHIARRKPYISEKSNPLLPGLESTCLGPGFSGIPYYGLLKPGCEQAPEAGLQNVLGRHSKKHAC